MACQYKYLIASISWSALRLFSSNVSLPEWFPAVASGNHIGLWFCFFVSSHCCVLKDMLLLVNQQGFVAFRVTARSGFDQGSQHRTPREQSSHRKRRNVLVWKNTWINDGKQGRLVEWTGSWCMWGKPDPGEIWWRSIKSRGEDGQGLTGRELIPDGTIRTKGSLRACRKWLCTQQPCISAARKTCTSCGRKSDSYWRIKHTRVRKFPEKKIVGGWKIICWRRSIR